MSQNFRPDLGRLIRDLALPDLVHFEVCRVAWRWLDACLALPGEAPCRAFRLQQRRHRHHVAGRDVGAAVGTEGIVDEAAGELAAFAATLGRRMMTCQGIDRVHFEFLKRCEEAGDRPVRHPRAR